MNSTTLTMRIPFDTLAYAKKLKHAGVSEEVAEVQAEALAEIVDDQIATKYDLKELEQATKRDLKELEQATKRDLKALEKATKRDLKELELSLTYKLTLRLGSMLAAGIVFLSILIKMH